MIKKRKIVKVNYGLASSYDNFIEINSKLKGNLRKRILDHELRHDVGKYSLKDFKNDFMARKPYFFQSLRFSLKHPEALINFFPFMYSYYGRFWSYNLSAFIPFAQFGIIFILFFFFLFKIPILLVTMAWIYLYFTIQLLLLIYTHVYVNRERIFTRLLSLLLRHFDN
jgi:hypothetical protein